MTFKRTRTIEFEVDIRNYIDFMNEHSSDWRDALEYFHKTPADFLEFNLSLLSDMEIVEAYENKDWCQFMSEPIFSESKIEREGF